MREILFRGKDKSGDFVYGFYLNVDVIHKIFIVFTEEEKKYNKGTAIENADGYWEDVRPETVGQYTGLTDKNGKKIFEGDIIAYKYKPTFDKEVFGYYKVEYNENLGVYEPFGDSDCAIEADEIKVVGNVFDKPELLEVK